MKHILYLLPKEGKFYKANLHSHTTCSDGRLTPFESKELYKQHGYSVLAYTDHRKYGWHKEQDDKEFLTIAAYEADIEEYFKDTADFSRVKTYHINFYDTKPWENSEEKKNIQMPERRYEDIYSINRYIDQKFKEGFLACYNHPYWSLQNYDDYKNLRGCFAMEIYNHGCEIDGMYGYNPQSYDEMLRCGGRLYCLATDDNHNRAEENSPESDSFGGFTMIKAEELSYTSIMDALKNGNFYSSMGPELKELYIEGNQLVVKCSPADKIYVIQEGRDCYHKIAKKGETITEARFTLSGKEGYIRVDIRDEKGLHANSNAYFMDEILKHMFK